MGDKLVMYCRGSRETFVRYNIYVVNYKLFCTLAFDVRKITCVPIVDGEIYYGKLTEVIEVEYFYKTKYVMFKCNWTDNMRDRGDKVDEYDLLLVNFKNLVHRREQTIDEPYVLTSQVDLIFYVKDERNPDWACAVRTKSRNVYDVGQGERP
jgi:hypothetical protein